MFSGVLRISRLGLFLGRRGKFSGPKANIRGFRARNVIGTFEKRAPGGESLVTVWIEL